MTIDPIAIISQVGFPIFICCWFMLRTEKVIKNNTKAFLDLKTEMNKK